MKQELEDFLQQTKTGSLPFSEVLQFIESRYKHTPTAFKNGEVENAASQNQGSAKVFAFAQLNGLSIEDTLYLFAEHYKAVLDHPDATDHQNIRQFMTNGWPGITFEGVALVPKP